MALLHEAGVPPEDVADRLNETDPRNLDAKQFRQVNAQHSQCMIVKLTDKVDVKRLKPIPLICARDEEFKSTHPGSLAAAGDLTIYHGYGEDKSGYWKGRYDTDSDRMRSLGLPIVGPQHPHGRQADPWPDEWGPGNHCRIEIKVP